jgi:hypothetical protein
MTSANLLLRQQPEEEGNFAMMRGLVRIAQEKARKDAG